MATRADRQEERRARRRLRSRDLDEPVPVTDLTPEDKAQLRRPEIQMLVNIFYIAHALRRRLERLFDVPTSNEQLALRALALYAPYPYSGACVAYDLGVTKQTAHELVLRIVRQGWAVRRDGVDARTRDIRIHQNGVHAAREVAQAMGSAMAELLARHGPKQRESAARAIRQLRVAAYEQLVEP